MKCLRFFTAFLLVFIHPHLYAMEIERGKLISHQEKTTGVVTGAFKESVNKKPYQAIYKQSIRYQIQKNDLDLISSNARIAHDHEASYPLGAPVVFHGSTGSFIHNTTNSKQSYQLETRFCLIDIENYEESQCIINHDAIILDAGGHMDTFRVSELNYTFTKSGPHILRISISVIADEKKTVYLTEDINWIYAGDMMSKRLVS